MAQTLQLIKEDEENVIESDEQPGPSRFEEEAVVSIMAKKGTATCLWLRGIVRGGP